MAMQNIGLVDGFAYRTSFAKPQVIAQSDEQKEIVLILPSGIVCEQRWKCLRS